MWHTVFDTYGNDRLTSWKQFRNNLETSNTPFDDVAKLWACAPFVSPYLDPTNPSKWPDPWHLVLDNRYDDLAMALGMLYTIKLTQRFMNSKCEIHTSITSENKDPRYFLVVDGNVLNLEYMEVVSAKKIDDISTNIIWSKHDSL